MSGSPSSKPELFEQVNAFVTAGSADSLTERQFAEFERLLRESDDACRLYAEYVQASVLLPSILSGMPDEESSSRDAVLPTPVLGYLVGGWRGTVNYFSDVEPLSYLIATILMGLFALGAWLWQVPVHYKFADIARRTPRSVAEPELRMVGRITGIFDCQWSKDGRPPYGYDNVPIGRQYKLDSGLLQITYDTGAKVILQGPCVYEVESATGGFLSLGKLTARVEKKGERGEGKQQTSPRPSDGRGAGGEGSAKATDQTALTLALSQRERGPDANPQPPAPSPLFAVRTPTAVVTDLGTEFGVEVEPQGETQVEVMLGAVAFAPVGSAAQAGQPVTLIAGQSATINSSNRVTRVPVDSRRFVRTMPKPTARRPIKGEWSELQPEGSMKPASDDLLQTHLAGAVADDGLAPPFEGQAISALYDGRLYGPGGEGKGGETQHSFSTRDGASVTFTLDTGTNKNGYSIRAIDVYSGYNFTRNGQKFKIEFGRVGRQDWLVWPAINLHSPKSSDTEFRDARSRIRSPAAGEATMKAGSLLAGAQLMDGDPLLSNGVGLPQDDLWGWETVQALQSDIVGQWDLGVVRPLGMLTYDYVSVGEWGPNPINIWLSNDGVFSDTPTLSYSPTDRSTWSMPWDSSIPYYRAWSDRHDLTGHSARYIKFQGVATGQWQGGVELKIAADVNAPASSSLTPFVEHVDRIRFTFYDCDNPWEAAKHYESVYREIDVFGSPTAEAITSGEGGTPADNTKNLTIEEDSNTIQEGSSSPTNTQ